MTSKATLYQCLLDTYGYNPYLSETFDDAARQDWMMIMAHCLSISEDKYMVHARLVEERTEIDTTDYRRLITEHISTSPHHVEKWTILVDLASRLIGLSLRQAQSAEEFAQLKKLATDWKITTGIDYINIYATLNEKPAAFLPVIKLTALQLQEVTPMYTSDMTLAILWRKMNMSQISDFTINPLKVHSSMSQLLCDDMKGNTDSQFDIPRRGRYSKVWSRLNGREMNERKHEAILYLMASHRQYPDTILLRHIIDELDAAESASVWRWSKAWDSKGGLLMINKLYTPVVTKWCKGDDSRLQQKDDIIEVEKDRSVKQIMVEQRDANHTRIMAPLTAITIALLSERVAYTRDELYNQVLKEVSMPLQKNTKTQLYRLIDKVLM